MEEEKAKIIRPEDCLPEMINGLRNGLEKGTTTHIPDLDKCWKWRKGEFNLWTGYSNEGKSLFIRYLSIIKVLTENWKFIFSAPEDYPASEFYDDLIHTIVGLPTDKDHHMCMSEKLYMKAFDKIKDNFFFVYMKPPYNTLKGTLVEFDRITSENHIDAAVIDPLLKFARPKELSERDDIYGAYVTTLMTDFSRQHNISLHLVMHQLTPVKTQEGFYSKPSMYTVKGGGSYADGTDNVLSIWRPKYAKDKLDASVLFSSLKIKKQKLVGIPQDMEMKFDRKTNRYTDMQGKNLFNFEKAVGILPAKKTLF